jgi:intraflagellar transport protein 74
MGRGTEAAVGVSLNANINVSDRPVTGQGMMGMKAQTQSQGRVIQDSSYYVGVIRNRIKDINNESLRLKSEYDQLNKDRTQLSQLERKYESLSKSKETLEGQLADYNLALDKTRTSTDPEDVEDMASRLSQKNRQTGQELDRILAARKQREAETANIDGQIEAYYRSIQARINDLEPGKLRAYNDLLARQREMQERASGSEARLNEINSRIRQYESDDKANAVRKQYMTLEKTYQGLKRDLEAIQEELEIANLDPKEAHTKFVARVNDFKNAAKEMESRAASIKSEIESAKKLLEDLNNNVEEDSGEAAKFELLQKRDQDMTAFMDKFESTKSAVLQDTENAQATVVALLEHMSRGIEDVANLPDQEMKGELDDVKSLKEKNLRTAERTMESLQVEERKRRKELDLLLQSEPKLKTELAGLKADMRRMSEEIEVFKDVNGMRREFEKTQQYLQEQKRVYVKRRDSMRQQVQALSVEHEGDKKALASHDIARELDDTEKRLKHYERAIFEIKEFVESKARESDFELIKSDCLKKLDLLNSLVVKASQEGPGRAMYLK